MDQNLGLWQLDERAEFVQYLTSTDNRLEAIIGMLVADDPCTSILQQLRLVQTSLNTIRKIMLTCQIKHCQDVILSSPAPEERVAEIARLAILYQLSASYFI